MRDEQHHVRGRNRLYLLLGGVLCLLLIAVIWVSTRVRDARDAAPAPTGSATNEHERSTPGSRPPPRDESFDTAHLQGLEGIRPPRGTMEDLADKGFPLMSNARREVVSQTAPQTLDELVADLGHGRMFRTCALGAYSSIKAAPDDIRRYQPVQAYVKVLRLIEEGRENKESVVPLIREAINECIADHDRVRKERKVELRKLSRSGSAMTFSEPRGYYEKHRQHQNPVLEFDRIHLVVYSGMYVLANLHALDADVLHNWLVLPKPPIYNCVDMNLWLVDRYYADNPQAPGAAEHKRLLGDTTIPAPTGLQSRWDAPWDIHDFLIKARGVNRADIPTIEVLAIPSELPNTLDNDTKAAILDNFVRNSQQQPRE